MTERFKHLLDAVQGGWLLRACDQSIASRHREKEKKRDADLLHSQGALDVEKLRTGWQERAGKLVVVQALNDSVRPSWIAAADEAGLRAIKKRGRVLRSEGVWGAEVRGGVAAVGRRRDRDERSTGHSRVLPRALQVLQCRPVPAWVRKDHVCARQLCRVIATAYPSPIFWLIDDSQFRRYYQIRTALRVSPKLPVKVEVNQLRNREYFFPVSSTFPEECLQFILRIATLLRITFLQVKFTLVKFVFFSRCNDSKIRLIRLSFRSKMLI